MEGVSWCACGCNFFFKDRHVIATLCMLFFLAFFSARFWVDGNNHPRYKSYWAPNVMGNDAKTRTKYFPSLWRRLQRGHLTSSGGGTCVASPAKKKIFDSWNNPQLESRQTLYFSGTTCRSFAITPATPSIQNAHSLTRVTFRLWIATPKTHIPAMDSYVLSLRCGKSTSVFVPSEDRDIVAEVWKCCSWSLTFLLLVLRPSCFFTDVRAGTSTGRGIFFVLSGSYSKKQHMVRYDTK